MTASIAEAALAEYVKVVVVSCAHGALSAPASLVLAAAPAAVVAKAAVAGVVIAEPSFTVMLAPCGDAHPARRICYESDAIMSMHHTARKRIPYFPTVLLGALKLAPIQPALRLTLTQMECAIEADCTCGHAVESDGACCHT